MRTGRYVLEARAIGLRPVRIPVALARDATTAVTVTLADTVVVLAATTVRERAVSHAVAEFETRRRSGAGWYVTADDIARRRPAQLLQVLEGAPGLEVISSPSSPFGSPMVVARRALGQVGKMASGCPPAMYVDGTRLNDVRVMAQADAMPVDFGVRPDQVHGIEVYASLGTVPARFASLDAGCGVILIWTKRDVVGR
jgi:hypothetical protein